MINLCLSNQELDLLKSIIGHTIISITADDWTQTNYSYGNILISTSSRSLAINNDYHYVPFFEDKEELTGFNVTPIENPNQFTPHTPKDELLTKNINQVLHAIEVVRDTITIYLSSKIAYTYIIDHAIIFKLSSINCILGLDNLLIPMTTVTFTDTIHTHLKPIEYFKDDWTYDGNLTPYTCTITRKVINLNEITSI